MNIEVSESELPAWKRETLFSEKPHSIPYGYALFSGEAVGARSLAELKILFDEEQAEVYAVWRPESENMILVSEVPELLEELKPKRQQKAKKKFKKSLFLFITSLIALAITLALPYLSGNEYSYPATNLGFLLIMWLSFVGAPFYENSKKLRIAQRLSEQHLQEEADETRFDIWVSRQESWFTKTLTSALIILSVLQVMKGGDSGEGFAITSKIAGLKSKSQIGNEHWRLWTAPFLHGSLIHIFFNASTLLYLGKRVEVLAKWPHFLMVFIYSALFGSYSSMHFLSGAQLSVGASGGIMGLLGFLLCFQFLHPKLAPKSARMRLVTAIVLMFIMGILGISFIDNAAHIGGLLFGALYGLIVFTHSNSPNRPRLLYSDWFIGVIGLASIILSLYMTYTKITQ